MLSANWLLITFPQAAMCRGVYLHIWQGMSYMVYVWARVMRDLLINL